MRTVRGVGGVCAAVLLVVALWSSYDNGQTAHAQADKIAALQREQAVGAYLRAVAACDSSTELRSLLNDIGDIVVPANRRTQPVAAALLARIHRYTDHNPNCQHLPPKPKEHP